MITTEYTNRGFRIYGRVIDSKGSEVRVQQSSAACEDAVWIFTENPNPNYQGASPHMTKSQVAELIEILQVAMNNMEDDWGDE